MVGAAGEVDLFVSYTAADEDWAQWVAWQCEDAGYTSCLRAWDFGPGSHVVARTHEATQRAARTVAVLSAAYLSCAFAQAQWQAVFAPDPAGRERGLVVVRVEDCAQPGLLAQMAGVDLFGVGAGEARRRLLAAIRGERGKPATAPPLPTRSFPPPAAQPTERASGAVTGAGPSFPGRLPPVWGPVPSRNLLFTGREESLAALHQRLLGDGDGDGRSVGLHGMGGVGKTQLAAEYAWRYSSGLGIVWWIDAETALGLRTGLAELARRLRVADGDLDERARAALAALGRRRDWLLIYDNVPDPHTLAALLPPATGRLLVTCRDPGMRRVGIELVEVAAFTRAETCHLLRRHLAELGDTDADRLGDAVGDLPLAVEQAGAYLAETTMPVDVYLAELAATPTVLLDEPSPHHPGLARTVSLAVDRLAATDPGAARLLHQVAFLAPEPVPLASTAEPDSGALIVGDPSTTYRTLVAISRLALAAGTTRMRLHRLVAALVRARLDDAATREAAAGALRLLATARPGDPADPSAWPAYALITPHVTAATRLLADWGDLTEPDDVRALLADTCWYLFRAGQTQTARHLATTARTRWLRRLGPDHTDSLRAAHTLAAALADLGDHKAARALDEDTLARRTRLLGADHADTLRSASQLALRLAALGDPASARALDEDTLRRRRRVLGPDHPHTLGSAANLSLRLADLGQHAAARTLDEEILARRRRTLGEDHPDTLASAANLANRLADLGQYARARALDEEILARRRRTLGEDHPDTLASAANLANKLADLGQHTDARDLDEEILARRRRTLGPDHPDTLTSANNLANRLAALGEPRAARELDEDTLARRRRILGDDHPDTLTSSYNLAMRLADTGDLAAACTLGEQTLAGLRRTVGADHPTALAAAHNLGMDLAAAGRLAPARTLLEDTLTRRSRLLGEQHPATLRTAQVLANLSPRKDE